MIGQGSQAVLQDGETTDARLLKAQAELARRFKIPDDAPVLPNMTSWCKVDFMVNELGKVMVIFDQPLPETVDWIEFDADVRMITFVTYRGKIFSLGGDLSRPLCDKLMKALDAQLIQVKDDGVGNGGMMPVMIDHVPLVVRHIGV